MTRRIGSSWVRGALVLSAIVLLPLLLAEPVWANSGYWIGAGDGAIHRFGDARDYGSVAGSTASQTIVCIASTPSGLGYWEVARDGAVYAFGDAGDFGSRAAPLNRPVVGMARTPTGGGYWLVAADGGIFTYGDALFLGSAGATHLNQPIVGMAATPTGGGYWLVAADGGIFTYGDARFAGSAAGSTEAVVGISPVGGGAGCNGRPSALVDRLAAADTYASSRLGVTGIAVLDTVSGEFAGNPSSDIPMRSASIVKVAIAMAFFARIEADGREPTATERSDIAAMLRRSDNDATSRLWGELGGPAVIEWLRQTIGATATHPPEIDHEWGFTVTTAHDLALIFASLQRGAVINASHRETILDNMRHVDDGQRWGIAEAVHRSLPAVKNGWFPESDAPFWRVHCGGIVDGDGRPGRWVVVVMTRYPIGLAQAYGADTCREVAARVLPREV